MEGFGTAGEEEVALFGELGYLVVNHVFTLAETQAPLEWLLDVIDGKNAEFKGVQFETKSRDILLALSPEVLVRPPAPRPAT